MPKITKDRKAKTSTKHSPYTKDDKIKLDVIQKREILRNISNFDSINAGLKDASAKLGVSFKSAEGMYYRYRKNKGTMNGNQMLSDEDETKLCALVEAFGAAHRPLVRKDLIEYVRKTFRKGAEWNGGGWYTKFMSRHKSRLTTKTGKGLKPERQDISIIEDVDEWIQWFPGWMKNNGLDYQWIVNADESRIKLDRLDSKVKAIYAKSSKRPAIQEYVKNKCATYLPFVAANGVKIMDVFVLPLVKETFTGDVRLLRKETRSIQPCYFMFSDTGYLSDDQWIPVIRTLHEIMQKRHSGVRWSILVDNLGVHKTPDTLKVYAELGMKVAFFPANVTHVLQPCDDKIFGHFKNLLTANFFREFRSGNSKERDVGKLLVPIAQKCADEITESIIVASFRDVGLCPWNPELIKNRVQNAVGLGNANPNDEYAKMVKSIIDLIPRNDKKTKTRLSITPSKTKIYDGAELAIASAEKEKEQKRILNEKELQRAERLKRQLETRAKWEMIRCRGEHDDDSRPKFVKSKPDSSDWLWCDHCDEFGLCPDCVVVSPEILESHEAAHLEISE